MLLLTLFFTIGQDGVREPQRLYILNLCFRKNHDRSKGLTNPEEDLTAQQRPSVSGEAIVMGREQIDTSTGDRSSICIHEDTSDRVNCYSMNN